LLIGNPCVPRGAGIHRTQPASFSLGNMSSYLEGKAAGTWSWPLTSIYCWCQECVELYLQPPQYKFMAWCR